VASRANCVVIRQQGFSILDDQLRVLESLGQERDPQARVPRPADARRRRERTVADLVAQGLREVPIPAEIGEREVVWREPSEVARRALALGVVAVYGSMAQAGHPVTLAQLRELWGPGVFALTAHERSSIATGAPLSTLRLSWRMESMATLMWALGWYEDPLPLDRQLEGEPFAEIARARARDEAIASARLRPAGEILDLLDAVVCRRWFCVDARQKGQPLPAGLEPVVLLERHYALQWLTRYGGAEWDEVQCPT
jgi:hypothetical protein